jgi:putative SbcD/Mre11-related phosphoesterase
MGVEPVPDRKAAVATTEGKRLLVVADYHAGIEAVLQADGVELDDGGPARRERLLALVAETKPDRLVVLGDLIHAIGDPWDAERTELTALFESLDVPVTLVKGNHDGDIEPTLADNDHDIEVTESGGTRIGDVGFVHGHTWPDERVLGADVLCMGHEHPVARLTDDVGGRQMEPIWLRGGLHSAPFADFHDTALDIDGDLVVFPAFNDRSGGTWINADEQDFLSPFLPEGLREGEAFLLDGTRLGAYRRI